MTFLRDLWSVHLHNLRARASQPRALVQHVHHWDHCRSYGQYRYRICLNGCNLRRPC